MIQKFPFGEHDLEILLPNKLNSSSIDTAVSLAKRFPQQELCGSDSLDKLREECLDYILSPGDLPAPIEYTAADKTKKLCVGKYWWDVQKLVSLDSQPRFKNLCKLMMGLFQLQMLTRSVVFLC